MSGELDDIQLVNFLLPKGRGNRREGTEFEVTVSVEVVVVVGLGSLWMR